MSPFGLPLNTIILIVKPPSDLTICNVALYNVFHDSTLCQVIFAIPGNKRKAPASPYTTRADGERPGGTPGQMEDERRLEGKHSIIVIYVVKEK